MDAVQHVRAEWCVMEKSEERAIHFYKRVQDAAEPSPKRLRWHSDECTIVRTMECDDYVLEYCTRASSLQWS